MKNPFIISDENAEAIWLNFIYGACKTCLNIRLFCTCFGDNPHVVDIDKIVEEIEP